VFWVAPLSLQLGGSLRAPAQRDAKFCCLLRMAIVIVVVVVVINVLPYFEK
jgi:t-SNARE complex subunit (syntaxin)